MIKKKIINILMKNGKKQTLEKNLFKILKLLNKNFNKDTKNLIKNFLIQSSIFVNLRNVKRGKSNVIGIPFILKHSLRIFYALKRIKNIIENQSNTFCKNFKEELFKTLNKKSENLKQKEDLYKQVFLKKSFSYYRWF